MYQITSYYGGYQHSYELSGEEHTPLTVVDINICSDCGKQRAHYIRDNSNCDKTYVLHQLRNVLQSIHPVLYYSKIHKHILI